MKKSILVFLSIIFIGAILISQVNKHQLIKGAQFEAEKFIKNNFENVELIHFPSDYYLFTKNKDIIIRGYIDDNPSLYFNITFDLSTNLIGFVDKVDVASDFPALKNECIVAYCIE